MAVCFYFVAGFRRRLARSQPCATRRRPLANRFFGDRVARPFVGLLALPRIFPTAALRFCCGACIDCDGGLDCFLAAGSVAFSADILCQPAVEEGVPPREGGNDFVRFLSQSLRSERRDLRHCRWVRIYAGFRACRFRQDHGRIYSRYGPSSYASRGLFTSRGRGGGGRHFWLSR